MGIARVAQTVVALGIVSALSLPLGCGKKSSSAATPTPGPVTLQGNAQKGPFQAGATVTVSALDANLHATGQTWSTETGDNLGTFAITVQSRYVEVTVNGSFFDEIVNAPAGPLTLTALADTTQGSTVDVNVLTTMEATRIQSLVGGGKTFAAAETEAATEALAAFHISNVTLGGPTSSFSIAGTSTGSAVVLAVSAVADEAAIQTATIGQSNVAALSQLLLTLGVELGGTIDTTTAAAITKGGVLASLPLIRTNLQTNLIGLGLPQTFTLAPFESYVDSNGGGIMNRDDQAPRLIYSAPPLTPLTSYWGQPAGFMGNIYAADCPAAGGACPIEMVNSTGGTPFGTAEYDPVFDQLKPFGSNQLATIDFITHGVDVLSSNGAIAYQATAGTFVAAAGPGLVIASGAALSTNAALVLGSGNGLTLVTPNAPTLDLGGLGFGYAGGSAFCCGGGGVAGGDSYAVVGGPATKATLGGAAYVFDLSGNLLQTLTSPNAKDTQFGSPIVANGSSIYIGHYGAPLAADDAVYQFDEGSGALVQTYQCPGLAWEPGACFTNHLALAANSQFFVVGAPLATVYGAKCGAVFVYDRTSGNLLNWIMDPVFRDTGRCNGFFGVRLALSGSSGLAVIGYSEGTVPPLGSVLYNYQIQ